MAQKIGPRELELRAQREAANKKQPATKAPRPEKKKKKVAPSAEIESA